MARKSPAASGRGGPSVMCNCAIFSTMVWPIGILRVIPAGAGRGPCRSPPTLPTPGGLALRPADLHECAHALLPLQVPYRVLEPPPDPLRQDRRRQGVELLLDLGIGERVARVALGIVELPGELAPIPGDHGHLDPL